MTVIQSALRSIVPKIPIMSRAYAAQAGTSKVAVLGAAGGIGQPLSLLLKSHPSAASHINALSLYDIVNTPGVAADLSHINTSIHVTGHVGKDQLIPALQGCEVVVIPAGVPRKPGMTRQDLFNVNAGIVRDLADAIAVTCPRAHILVISNPVNSTVPIVAETLKKKGVYDRNRVFGVTTLDVVRASTFVGEVAGKAPQDVEVTVVGGHSGKTIVPLLSKVNGVQMPQDQIEQVTNRIQFGGDEVVKAKDGAGSATLSMAYAGARFTMNLLRALHGESGVVEPAFIENDQFKEKNVSYFATRVTLGKNGVEQIHPVETGGVSDYERGLLDAALADLGKNIQDGVDFAAKL